MKTLKTAKYKQSQNANNPLNGKTKQRAVSIVNNKIIPHDKIKGFFSDEAWEGVNQIWTAFNDHKIDWNISGSEYYPVREVPPQGKVWNFEIEFINNKGRKTTLYGFVIASGAGTVEDPLSKYDIAAYVS